MVVHDVNIVLSFELKAGRGGYSLVQRLTWLSRCFRKTFLF